MGDITNPQACVECKGTFDAADLHDCDICECGPLCPECLDECELSHLAKGQP